MGCRADVVGVAQGVSEDILATFVQTSRASALKLVCILQWLELLTEKDIQRSAFTGKKQLTRRAACMLPSSQSFLLSQTDSTKKNLEMRVAAENGATAGKFDLAKRAKAANLDAIHDTVHEMAIKCTKNIQGP